MTDLGVAKAHAEHLQGLIQAARNYLKDGKPIPESLWDRIEEIAQKMGEAL